MLLALLPVIKSSAPLTPINETSGLLEHTIKAPVRCACLPACMYVCLPVYLPVYLPVRRSAGGILRPASICGVRESACFWKRKIIFQILGFNYFVFFLNILFIFYLSYYSFKFYDNILLNFYFICYQ